MNKKIMLLSLAAVSAALLALPAFASATAAHISATTEFSVSGGTGQLFTTTGSRIHCTGVTGDGKFTTTTTGTVNLTFTGCTEKTFGLHCQTSGDATGVITAKNLEFHLIMVEHNGSTKPGILITPPGANEEVTPEKRLFSAFTCFGVTTKVFGSGIIGTITHPGCNGESEEAGLEFKQSAVTGHQTHITWTGKTYDLESTIGGGGTHTTSAIDSTSTIKFTGKRKLICTP